MRRIKRLHGVAAAILLGLGLSSGVSTAADTAAEIKAAKGKPEVRGSIVFKAYCVLCHGERGDGQARADRLYGGAANLVIRARPRDYLEKIVRQGGEAVGASKFMPVWQDELSEEQISDVVAYLATVPSAIGRGEVVFKTNCILCHGVKGDGKGRASVLYNPPPSDLVATDKNDDYKRIIIGEGGAAMGRSDVMPPWKYQLSEQEISDVVDYLRTIQVKQ